MARIPEILFGAGTCDNISNYLLRYGPRVFVLIGSQSLKSSGKFDLLISQLNTHSIQYSVREISQEPSPELIDNIVLDFSGRPIDCIIAIGGGSVLDAGKAVSAMFGRDESIEEYLEGIGEKEHDGSKIPFIAVPTTAGTGSECTRNAVISRIGQNGFKSSIRHHNFVPEIAIIDSELTLSCPAHITAACGMDAFTQLLESFVSTNASPLTDALAFEGIRAMKNSFTPAVGSGAQNIQVRSDMCYAALLSGITLTNAGLGIVHGFAASIGGHYNIPHGVICGTLIGAATRINITNLRRDREKNQPALEKYAKIGRLITDDRCNDMDRCCDNLVDCLEDWIRSVNIPKLGEYGFNSGDIDMIVSKTAIKYNPALLRKDEIKKILSERI